MISPVLLLVWVPLTMAQVDREIDDPEDLLAVESFVNEVDLLRPIEPAPPGFGGQRLTQRQPTSARQDPGQGQKAAAMTTVQEYENVINEDGSYSFRYATSDGSRREETAAVNPEGGHTASGSFDYVGPDGRSYAVQYEAGINGYHAFGAHLPTPPPLPPALQRWEDAKQGRIVRQQRRHSGNDDVANRRKDSRRKGKTIQFRRPLQSHGGRIKFRNSHVS